MDLIAKITSDLTLAQKEKDGVGISTLRFLISNLQNARIAKGEDLTGDEVILEIKKDAKRHQESIDAYEKAGRGELVQKEKAELDILSSYLPQQFSDEELETMVGEAIGAVDAKTIADMGRVIKAVMSSAGAKADGGRVAEIARRKLGS